jgi:hypothetical protein
VIHLRVVSPPDVTPALVPMLVTEPAVLNLTVLPGAVRNPDGDAVQFDVLHGAANEIIGRLRDLGLEQRGSIVLENVDTSISALADRATARRGRFQQFTPVWAEIEARIALEGTYPPSWFELLVIARLIGAVGLTNSQILIVGAMVAGIRRHHQPGVRRDQPRLRTGAAEHGRVADRVHSRGNGRAPAVPDDPSRWARAQALRDRDPSRVRSDQYP